MKFFNIQNLKLDKKQMTITTVVFILLGYGFVYQPLASQINLKKKEWQRLEGDLSVARGFILKKDDLGRKGDLLSRQEISLAIDEITKMGRRQKINFISISPQEIQDVPDASYRRLPIRPELEAEYKDLGAFWGALRELHESLVTVKDFKIAKHETVYSILHAQVTIELYIRGKEGE